MAILCPVTYAVDGISRTEHPELSRPMDRDTNQRPALARIFCESFLESCLIVMIQIDIWLWLVVRSHLAIYCQAFSERPISELAKLFEVLNHVSVDSKCFFVVTHPDVYMRTNNAACSQEDFCRHILRDLDREAFRGAESRKCRLEVLLRSHASRCVHAYQ